MADEARSTAVTQIRDILSDTSLTTPYIESLLDDTNNVERAITTHFGRQAHGKTQSSLKPAGKTPASSAKKPVKKSKVDINQPRLNTFFVKPKTDTAATTSVDVPITPVKSERKDDAQLAPVFAPARRVEIINENSQLSREISEIAAAQASSIRHNTANDEMQPPPLEASSTPTHKLQSNEQMNGASGPISFSVAPDKDDIYHAKSPYEACWRRGQPVPYQHLSRTYAVLEHTTNRKQMMNMLTVMFWYVLDLTPTALYAAVMLTTNSLGPSYENMTLGVGGGMLSTVVRSLTGISRQTMHDEWTKFGDLGLIAHRHSVNQALLTKPKPLTVEFMFQSLLQIANISGDSSQNRKSAIIRKLCIATTEHEITYVIRTLEAELRVGAVVTTVMSALAKAAVLHTLYGPLTPAGEPVCTYERVQLFESIIQFNSPVDKLPAKQQPVAQQIIDAIKQLRSVYSEFPNLRDIIACLVEDPARIHTLTSHLHLTCGVPIKPMLARITKNWNQVFQLYAGMDFTAEIKYDGMRAQIHYVNSDNVKIYSRHMLDTTKQWPELVQVLRNAISDRTATQSYILDVEIVAVEKTDDNEVGYRILPFQELTKRARGSKTDNKKTTSPKKANAGAAADELSILADMTHNNSGAHVMVIVFDVLYVNGESLMRQPLVQRRDMMMQMFTVTKGTFEFAEHMDIAYSEWQDDNAVPRRKLPKPKQGRITNVTADIDADDDGSDIADTRVMPDDDSGDGEDSADDGELDFEAESISPSKKAKPSRKDIVDASAPTAQSVSTATADSDSDADRYNNDQESMTELQRIVVTKLQSFLVEEGSIRGEGLMLKSLSAIYEPDVRTDKWIKIKKDYIGGIGVNDSFDCVPIGGFDGNGRKAGFISPWLLAVYNPDTDEWQTLCKVMSGFSDSEYDILTKRYKTQYRLPSKPHNYIITDGLMPNYFWDTKEVWEIRGADLTISPKHTAAMDIVTLDKGISLRFPRFIRIRNKPITDATTSEQVAQFFKAQNISVKVQHKPR